MKITALTPQQRDNNRVNVFIDGKYRFSLDVLQLSDLGVKVGRDINEQQLAELEQESQFGKVYTRALEYALIRPRSQREMRDYLYRKTLSKKYKSKRTGEIKDRLGVSKELTERVFERLQEKGYVDDQKFADFWVENRNQRKGSSLRKLAAELVAKGVDRTIIDQVLADTDRTDKSELQKIIVKKRSKYSDDQKFMAYLARQGFSYDDIKEALNQD